MRWGYKHGRELARRMSSYRGEYVAAHPAFPAGSRAACSADASPAAIQEADIQYTAEDDRAIDEYTRRIVATAWHNVRPCLLRVGSRNVVLIAGNSYYILTTVLQLGTCAMKPRDKGGVVDSALNVYGVSGLKVAGQS